MITLEYSSMCLNEDNYRERIDQAQKLAGDSRIRIGIQIHNSIEKGLFEKLIALKGELPITVHSPVFSKYFINLAHPDFNPADAILKESVRYLERAGTRLLFFHGFFMTEEMILHDMKNYRKTMQDNIPEKYSYNRSFIMNPEFFDTEEFRKYRQTFIRNYEKARNLYPDYIICLENDFTGIGSGLQRPREIFELVHDLWFDLGHFWCSSLLFGFDYYEMCDRIIREKKIHGVHINHNLMNSRTKIEDLKDSHTHLHVKSDQDLGPVIRKLRDKGVEVFTLEILDGDIEDMKILYDWICS
ncbi:MAG: hypothetical protein PHF84_07320 [bacterium]|nr:hypothetical protein [bacterium]